MRRAWFALVMVFAVGAAVGCAGDSRPLLEQVRSSGVLRVGAEGIYPPFSFRGPDDTLTGYDIEVARAVAARMGVRAEFVEMPWDSLFAGLRAKRFAMVANQVAMTPERELRFDFSTPYTYSDGVILVRAENREITKLADLKGKKSAQTATSTWGKIAAKAGARVEAIDGFVPSVALLKAGRVDAVVNDRLAVAAYLKQTGDTGVRVVGAVGEPSRMAFAARKNSGLIGTVNTALSALRADGTLARISDKYFGTDVSGS